MIFFPSGVLPSYGGCWTRLCPICQAWLVFFIFLFCFLSFCTCILIYFVSVFYVNLYLYFVSFCNSYFRIFGQELKPKPRSEGSRAVVARLVCRLENQVRTRRMEDILSGGNGFGFNHLSNFVEQETVLFIALDSMRSFTPDQKRK